MGREDRMKVRLKHERLARELVRRNLSLNHWGQKLGLGRGHLSLLVNGKRPHPTPGTRRKLIKGLKVEFDDLFEVIHGPHRQTAPQPAKAARRSLLPLREGEKTMDSIRQDLRYALRSLARHPAYALTLVLILALGIGANTAIFSVLNGVLLEPLPFGDPERLVAVWDRLESHGSGYSHLSGPEFLDLRERNQAFEEIAAGTLNFVSLTGRGEPRRLEAAYVSGNYFEALGLAPSLGRGFFDSDARPGAVPVTLLSRKLWQSLWPGEDTNLAGKTVTLDGTEYEVVGVLPSGFGLPNPSLPLLAGHDVFLPLALDLRSFPRGSRFLFGLGRIREGVTIEQARSDLAALSRQLNEEYSDHYQDKGFSMAIVPLLEQVSGGVRPALIGLQGTVGFLLLLVAVNLAALQLARATARRGEVAIRLALGANRSRLAGQFGAEAFLVALPGGAIGVGLAALCLTALRALSPQSLPRLEAVAIDSQVLFFALVTSVGSALLFGLAPLLEVSLKRPVQNLEAASRTGAGSSRGYRARQFLVSAEVALALLLTVGSGLFLRSLWQLQSVDPGFQAEGVLTTAISLPRTRYPSRTSQIRFFQDLSQQLAALPSVQAAGTVSRLPFSQTDMSGGVTIEDPKSEPGPVMYELARRHATPGYFEAMGIELVQGRLFDGRDRQDSLPVALIDERLARRLWPAQSPLGQRLHRGGLQTDRPWRTIVGVVRHVKHRGLDVQGREQVYFPLDQQPDNTAFMFLALRGSADPSLLAGLLRRTVGSIDPDLPLASLKAMDERMALSLAQPRLLTLLVGLFAVLGLCLAAMGIYGIISYSVQSRRREIGLRMALGAQSGQVFSMVVKRAMSLTGAGLLVGLVASLGLGGYISSLLFQVEPHDPFTLAGCTLFLALVALAACSLPARRAARTDPIQTLRTE